MIAEQLTIASRDGLVLEAELEEPEPARAALVLCHPHPQMGGTMNAPLLIVVKDELVRRGWAVLRFNFRGIGRSEGEPSTGSKEVADAEGAVGFMRDRLSGIPLAIAGWSFGAAVAVRVASQDDALAACVAIAPAVKEKPGITEGLPLARETRLTMPFLVLCAVNDELVDLDEARAWAETAGADFYEMKGANHFFWAKYEKLSAVVGDFLDGA